MKNLDLVILAAVCVLLTGVLAMIDMGVL